MRVLAASDMSVLLAARCKKADVCLEWFTQWCRPVGGGFNWADEGRRCCRDAAGAPTTHLIGFTALRAKTTCNSVTRCIIAKN